jgi:ribonuclease P protein component
VFDRFRTEGCRARQGALWCSWIADDTAVPPRVAYAVGRNVGGAVARNRLRRQLRALVAAAARGGTLTSGWYLIGAAPGAVSLDAPSLETTFSQLVARIQAEVDR